MARISVGEIMCQEANGGSPKYVFVLESNPKGCTAPAKLGMQACAAPRYSFVAWKTEKKVQNQKDLDFLGFFFYFESRRDQIDVASTVQKKLCNTEVFNDFFI